MKTKRSDDSGGVVSKRWKAEIMNKLYSEVSGVWLTGLWYRINRCMELVTGVDQT